jgi:UDP-N-acetylmuramate--alanine ligase
MQHIHFIGLGGAGMSGLAEIALARGVAVSGSDLADSTKLRQLKKLGAEIHIGHRPGNIPEHTDLVVYTSAVNKSDNPELEAARNRGIRTMRRADFLGELTSSMQTIAVAGTHGKTTTSSMIAHILLEAGLDPMVSIGASVKELGGKNARAGSGSLAVVEADEYDRSFLSLKPFVAVITTLEAEHLDIYKDLSDLQDTFVEYANAGKQQGVVIVNIDEPAIRALLTRLNKRIVTYGIDSEQAKYQARNIEFSNLSSTADIYRTGERIGTLSLGIPGRHNIANALAAIATAESLAIDVEISAKALASFRGAERRSQVIGEVNGILIMDDYAHHPTEVEATLSALRSGYPGRRILAAFQPHTFTRTRDFADAFGAVFAKYADGLYLAEIYPAREKPIEGITSKLILDAATADGLKKAFLLKTIDELPGVILRDAKAGDIVVTLGAGSITEQAPLILQVLKASASEQAPSKRPRTMEKV